jgi:hypothetical protein
VSGCNDPVDGARGWLMAEHRPGTLRREDHRITAQSRTMWVEACRPSHAKEKCRRLAAQASHAPGAATCGRFGDQRGSIGFSAFFAQMLCGAAWFSDNPAAPSSVHR